MKHMTTEDAASPQKTSPALVLAVWLVVAIPAGWGIYNTLLNAMKLFQ